MALTTVGRPTAREGGPTTRAGSLRFRLVGCVSLIVLLGMAGSLAVGYVLESRARRRALLASLTEQAHSLLAARGKITSPAEYAAYVNEYCARMDAEISPGHHILVLDRRGNVVASSRQHSGIEVERALLRATAGQAIVPFGTRELAQARLPAADGGMIVVAQYLDHMQAMIRREMLTRGISTTLIGLLILVLLFATIRRWVLRPMDELERAAHACSRRDFAVRAKVTGPQDIRSLLAAFNRMASELGDHETRRLAEMAKARQFQAGFLPAHLPEIPGLAEVVARFEPAEDVAGDLYDIIPLPDGRTALVVLDVCGHGVSAALLTGIAKMALHWRLAGQGELPCVVAKVNVDLLDCLTEGQFVTMCVGVWDPRAGTWTYCAAGHPGGVLQTSNSVEYLPSTGPLLGVVADAEWTQQVIELQPGQRLWLYTDGLIEAGAPNHMLDLTGLARILRRTAGRAMGEQASALIEEALSRQKPDTQDDVTLVGIERMSPQSTEGERP